MATAVSEPVTCVVPDPLGVLGDFYDVIVSPTFIEPTPLATSFKRYLYRSLILKHVAGDLKDRVCVTTDDLIGLVERSFSATGLTFAYV